MPPVVLVPLATLAALVSASCASSARGGVRVGAPASSAILHEGDDETALAIPGDEGDDPAAPVTGTPPAAGAAGAAFLAEVERELRIVKRSTYTHHAQVDERSGTFDFDCSGFLDYALSRATPDALAAVQTGTPRRPRSSDYVTFLAKLPPGGTSGRWQRLGRVQDLVAGDVVVWLKPAESRSTNTGHTMIVRAAPAADPNRPSAFFVAIIDSTEHPHGVADARAGLHRTGLGQGEIVLVADDQGAPIAYRWSREKTRDKATTIALGRLH